jgi:hypothetical protein
MRPSNRVLMVLGVIFVFGCDQMLEEPTAEELAEAFDEPTEELDLDPEDELAAAEAIPDADENAPDSAPEPDRVAAAAPRWYYGPWGAGSPHAGQGASCSLTVPGVGTARGSAYFARTDGDGKARNSGGTAARRAVKVRAKAFAFNNWGEGGWAYTFRTPVRSTHDCGSVRCWFVACRTAIYQ